MSSAFGGLERLLLARENRVVGSQDALAFQRSLHFPAYFAKKLNVEHTYEGHNGCVNRLGWNSDGSLLVSVSDDRRAIIWHYPDVGRPPLALNTEHRANIFGCQFLPCTENRCIVTGAMDDTVQLHDLEASPAARAAGPRATGGQQGGSGGGHTMRRRAGAAQDHLQLVTPRTKVYLSHKDRVKDVKVEAMNPHNFWSGGEDGDVRQYDTRMPNQDKWESPTVLVQVRYGHRSVQVKSLDINKAHPHLMAVAGSDPYIRLYDRRKLSAGTWKRRGTTPAVMALAPPHMPLAGAARHGRSHATYVSFANRGDKLVTTYHGDHAYCFDITSSGDLAALFPRPATAAAAPRQLTGRHTGRGLRCYLGAAAAGGEAADRSSDPEDSSPEHAGTSGRSGTSGSIPLPLRAEEAKARGNAAIFEREWAAAVKAFTEALYFAPGAPVLYALRAEVLLRRAWVGDAALALRDCDTAVALDDSCSRAFLSRIHALQSLHQYQCALTAVDEYRRRFPGRAAADIAKLSSELRVSVDERRRLYEARRQQQERRRVQRAAEALARTPRRVATSPPLRDRRIRTVDPGNIEAEASASGAVATPPIFMRVQPTANAVVATAAVTAERGPSARAVEGSTTRFGDSRMMVADAEISSTGAIVGPPPPLPAGVSASSRGVASAEPNVTPTVQPAASAFTSNAGAIGSVGPAVPAASGVVGIMFSGGSGADPGQPLGLTASQAVEEGLQSLWEEASGVDTAEAAALDERRSAGDDEGLHAANEDGEDAERAQARSDTEYDSEAAEVLSREGDGTEEDPDLELFLQYYARAMELAGSGGDGEGSNLCGRKEHAGSQQVMLFHMPGAWGGSPGGRRMLQRYVGQCNVQTDIKEVTFIGSDDLVVAAGSDCGRVFLYDAGSGAVLRALAADEDVANCVQCHPSLPVLATSGIENVVRLWTPRDSLPAAAAVSELDGELESVVERNQARMKEGPTVFRPSVLQDALQENPQLLHLFMSQLYGRGNIAGRGARGASASWGAGADRVGEGEHDDDDEEGQPEVSCRMA